MPFISDREERHELQNATYDDGSVSAGFAETFDAAVGFAIDEGLSTSRMLNNEMYETRRQRAKEIFDSGVSRETFMDDRGLIDYNEMSKQHEGIEPDAVLYEQKNKMLSDRREYYTDVMRRSDSVSGNLLGSMTGFMTDPVNIATMAVGTPFAVAKGVGVLSKVMYGGAGAAVINVTTEAMIQPFVLDYKLDIDSPYGVDDAITNIAMAAGGGFVLGGAFGGISGWLGKIRGDADNIKITPDLDVDELRVAVEQVDEMITNLKAKPAFDVNTAKENVINDIKTGLSEEASKQAPEAIMDKVLTSKRQLEKDLLDVSIPDKTQINKKLENINGILERSKGYKKAGADLEKLEKGEISKEMQAKIDEGVNAKLIEEEAAVLRNIETEREFLNRSPDAIDELEQKIITDEDLDGVFRAMDEPKMIVDGKPTDAGKVVAKFDDDIDALEAMKVCMSGQLFGLLRPCITKQEDITGCRRNPARS